MSILQSTIIVQSRTLFNHPGIAVIFSEKDGLKTGEVEQLPLFSQLDISNIFLKPDNIIQKSIELRRGICIPNLSVQSAILKSDQDFFWASAEKLGLDISSLREKNLGSVMCIPLMKSQAGEEDGVLGALLLWSLKQNHFDPLVHLEVGQSFAEQIFRAIKKLHHD